MPPSAGRIPLAILLTPGIGGPHAWASRLRERLAGDRDVLIVVRGSGGVDMEADFTYDHDDDLRDWLLRRSPAVVMPNWLWSAYDICSQARASGARLSVVAYCRSDDLETYYEPLRRNAVHWDWLVAVSAAIRDELGRQGYDRTRLRLMKTFVERPEVLVRTWQAKPLRILYSGRVEQVHKNVMGLPEVALALRSRNIDFTLTVAGEGSSAPALRSAVRTAGVEAAFNFLGQVPPAAMAEIYLTHDALVLPSAVEGRSNALLEAMAHGCVPVIFRTPTGWDEVLPPDLHHLAVPQGDVGAMADALAGLVQDEHRLRRFGRRAHAATVDSTWSAYRVRFEALLDEVSADL